MARTIDLTKNGVFIIPEYDDMMANLKENVFRTRTVQTEDLHGMARALGAPMTVIAQRGYKNWKDVLSQDLEVGDWDNGEDSDGEFLNAYLRQRSFMKFLAGFRQQFEVEFLEFDRAHEICLRNVVFYVPVHEGSKAEIAYWRATTVTDKVSKPC